MSEPGAEYVEAARRIRSAGNCADVASALIRAVLTGTPRDRREWQQRTAARTATENELKLLEMRLMQASAGSVEMGNDLRISCRQKLERILRRVSRLDGVDLFRFADVAVTTAAALAGSPAVLQSARENCIGRICAWMTLGGSLFVPSNATEFAARYDVSSEDLNLLLLRAAQPLRLAIDAGGVTRVGLLHTRRDIDAGLSLRATLDGSGSSTPVIRIELTAAELPDRPSEDAEVLSDAGAYSARLLRALVG